MRQAGDSRTFIAAAAVLMAGLVIATMLAINARLQSALAPTVEQAGAPAINVGPTAGPPVLQNTAAPSIANSGANSGDNPGSNAGTNSGANPGFNAGSNSGPAATHVAARPAPTAVRPAAKTPAASLAADAKAAQPGAAPAVPPAPAPPVAGAQPPTVPTPVITVPAVLPAVIPVPLPVVIVVRPPAVVPPTPSLVTEATGTVTVAPDSDLGDGIASNGETHHRHHRDKSISGPDLTAAPAGHDSTTDPKSGDEEHDGDDHDNGKVATLEVRPDSLLSLIFGDDSHPGDRHH
ncbi:MAG: hypothetical protein QOD01_236 [Actinomycetota bacterium]|nr:hypothetical protein [Actinomycetota bacterium]